MALQLVRTGEPLAAEEPVADERPLARVPAQVGLQMGGLAIHLATARDVATVDRLLSQPGCGSTQALQLLAVGAVAGGAPCSTAPVASTAPCAYALSCLALSRGCSETPQVTKASAFCHPSCVWGLRNTFNVYKSPQAFDFCQIFWCLPHAYAV